MRVAIQGEAGSFHHLAGRHWYGEDFEIVACPTFPAVFKALRTGKADQAVVAIENSLYGSINSVYDLISKHGHPIVGELSERIHQHMIGLPGTKAKAVKAVVSHPVALEQCSDFLDRFLPKATRTEYYDTAAAAQLVKTRGDQRYVAIASGLAAELAGLPVLLRNIENDPHNYTRFVVVAPDGRVPAGANKASLVLQTSHKPGALYAALGVFAAAGINLTKLQSRPIT
ncbi:MAG TPA: prephenate dehydratase domain-containing protein, partial [Candidatus Saccharimonadales bacterium]|nr:prephenate dehydratase domain-containing protein [Candidatus Saccharimonadales bacterium]